MKSFLVLFIVCIVACTSAAQNGVNGSIVKMFDTAGTALCNGDTLKTIAILEKIEKLYPTDGAIVLTNCTLAKLYLINGRTNEAKEELLYAFSLVAGSVTPLPPVCNKFMGYLPEARAELCFTASQLYFKQHQFDSTYYFLNLADDRFLPTYGGCVNGMLMYRSFLSPYFADYYLAIGDTAKAINRLLDFCTKPDGDPVAITKKLKSILLQKWTQQEITKQVRKGLQNITFTDAGDDNYYANLTLFGHTVREYIGSDKKFYRNVYKKNRSLKILQTAGL